MSKHTVRETREKLSHLLDEAAAGEDVVITRRGLPVARLSALQPEPPRFPERQALRQSLPAARETAADLVRDLRDTERF